MKERRGAGIADAKVSVRVALSGMWTSIMFVFAYVDILGFWRSDVIHGALDAKVPESGFRIGQTFLLLTTLYVMIPSLMIAATLLAPARLARSTNLVVSALYLFSIVIAAIGAGWAYYLVGSVVEGVLLVLVAAVAWNWPKADDATAHHRAATPAPDRDEHAPPSGTTPTARTASQSTRTSRPTMPTRRQPS